MLTRTVDCYREEKEETIVSACELFGVSRQVYYRSKQTMNRRQSIAKEVLKLVLSVRQIMPRIGTRKLYFLLQNKLSDIGVGRDKLFAILKANKMLVKPKKNYRTTTNSYHRFHKHKNLIEDVVPEKPEQIWVSDITYIGSRGNHRYLALVTDAYSKKIVGYDLSSSLSADGAIRALLMGLKQRKYKYHDLTHHSDRGLQYCCDDYQKILTKKNVKCSMTESYDPYANAVAERVNGILKQEFNLEEFNVKMPIMQLIIKDSVKVYNVNRPHLSCCMKTPEQMHKQNSIKIKTYKKQNRLKASLQSV
jgi:transposase InsO family protein